MKNLSSQMLIALGIVLIVVKLMVDLLIPIGIALVLVGVVLYFIPPKKS